MANIVTVKVLLNKASAARENGHFTEAANLAIEAQRTAKQCRATSRGDLAWSAHNVIAASKMQATNKVDRSKTGRVLSESLMVGWVF